MRARKVRLHSPTGASVRVGRRALCGSGALRRFSIGLRRAPFLELHFEQRWPRLVLHSPRICEREPVLRGWGRPDVEMLSTKEGMESRRRVSAATFADEARTESRARWAYRAVVFTFRWPSWSPISGTLSPSARAREAYEWRKSCRRTPSRSERLRTRSQVSLRFTTRAPWISLRRHPVSARRRMAAAAWVEARHSAGAALSAWPSRHSSSRVRKRSSFSTMKRETPRSGACAATESTMSRTSRFEPNSRFLGSRDAPWPDPHLIQSVSQPQGLPADWRSSWPRWGIAVPTLDLQGHPTGGSFTEGPTPALPRPLILAGRLRVSRTTNRTWRRTFHTMTSGPAQDPHGYVSLAGGVLEDG